MKIGIVGTGYVGLVTGVCLADFGHQVTCMDSDTAKIDSLKKGEMPIYEPGLKDLVERNVYYKRLMFAGDIRSLVEENEVIFIAVGTPPKEDGSADLKHVLSVAGDIGSYINDYKVVVDKSTVPVGTGQQVKSIISEKIKERSQNMIFDVVSNPEFLREGKAIYDFTHPDRIVIGTESEEARNAMIDIYRVLYLNQTPFVFTNLETAEMIKYASNAFLAVKISYINEMALLAEKAGANIQDIAKAMGMDGRISAKFLHAGPGYGGSCFPKDTQAISHFARSQGLQFRVVDAAIEANQVQKKMMVELIQERMGGVKNKIIAILGLSFKPETDDVREAPSLEIVRGLVAQGARIRTFCPKGMEEAKWRLQDIDASITYCSDEYEAVTGAHAVCIITEWHQFRGMALDRLKELMSDDYMFDLRNIYSRDPLARELFKYYGVGVN